MRREFAYNKGVNLLVQTPLMSLFDAPEVGPVCHRHTSVGHECHRHSSPCSEHISQLRLGTAVRLLEDEGDWLCVEGPDGYRGWCRREETILASEEWMRLPRLCISRTYVNLRHAPRSQSGPLMCVPGHIALPVAEREEGWFGLLLPDRRVGWLEEWRTEPPLPRPADADSVIATAREYVRAPYLWGGVSGFGLDCSGLVQSVFELHGLNLPRDAHQQASLGDPVERDDVAPGDLLFFAASPDAPQRRITHVGIALDCYRMIHAWASPGEVVETEIDPVAPFWGARRVLGKASKPCSEWVEAGKA